MKKWIALAAVSLVMNVHANQLWCGYMDYFHVWSSSHRSIYVKSGLSDQNIVLILDSGSNLFSISDGSQCSSGYAHIMVGDNEANSCALYIQDGPLMNHPTVKAFCNGIRYINTQYNGTGHTGNHSYSINFD